MCTRVFRSLPVVLGFPLYFQSTLKARRTLEDSHKVSGLLTGIGYDHLNLLMALPAGFLKHPSHPGDSTRYRHWWVLSPLIMLLLLACTMVFQSCLCVSGNRIVLLW